MTMITHKEVIYLPRANSAWYKSPLLYITIWMTVTNMTNYVSLKLELIFPLRIAVYPINWTIHTRYNLKNSLHFGKLWIVIRQFEWQPLTWLSCVSFHEANPPLRITRSPVGQSNLTEKRQDWMTNANTFTPRDLSTYRPESSELPMDNSNSID